MREAIFQAALERALNAPERQTRVRRVNSGTAIVRGRDGSERAFRGAPKGTGDLVGYVAPDGLHLEVEAKATGGRLRPDQRRRAAALERAGAVYVAVWPASEDLDEAVRLAVATVDDAIAGRRHRP